MLKIEFGKRLEECTTIQEAAKRLGVCRGMIYYWSKSGKIRIQHFKSLDRTLVLTEDVEKMLLEQASKMGDAPGPLGTDNEEHTPIPKGHKKESLDR